MKNLRDWLIASYEQTQSGWDIYQPITKFISENSWSEFEHMMNAGPEKSGQVMTEFFTRWPDYSVARQDSWQRRWQNWHSKWPKLRLLGLETGLSGLETQQIRSMAQNSKKLNQFDPAKIVTFLDTEYPSCFKQLDSPPPVLWANHPWKEWKWPAKRLAVIGSRKMSTYGRLISSQLVTELVADFAVSIISGCARGVDGQSHNSALLADGRTIGVLGCGLQAVTQREKRWLNEPRALIISEFPSRQAPQGWMFVQRNRLIAGAAQAVLVIEAQEKSGTLITVSAALEQGKEVLVVPQSLWNQNAGGIIHLANNGATLVRSAGEIMTQIWPESLVGEASSDSDLAKKSVNAPATAQAMLNLLKEHQGQLLLSDLLFKKPKLVSNTNWHSTLTYLEKVKKISCSYGVVRVL